MSGLLFFVAHPKADREQRPRSSDGGGVGPWPKIGNFLVIPYGLHGVGSHDEGRVIARSRQRFRLRGRGKNGCPGKYGIWSALPFFLFTSERQEGEMRT